MTIDLHCDLLGCVEQEPKLHFEHPDTNCSIPQLLQGGVRLQTLAVAAITRPGSTGVTQRQVELYQKLLKEYPSVAPYSEYLLTSEKLHCIFAIENASGLLEEGEPFEEALKRFETYQAVEKILYVSLTWNQENRFGGGNAIVVGLKRDGELFLEYLEGKGVAIDLSHTSDALAHDILNYIDKKGLHLIPIASHSNFRSIKDIPRNLSNTLAQEIIKRRGVIGMNFVRRFVGEGPQDFLDHIHHGLALGGEDALCLGSDFYGGIDIPLSLLPERSLPVFQEDYSNASCYPRFLELLRSVFPERVVQKISYKNAHKHITANISL